MQHKEPKTSGLVNLEDKLPVSWQERNAIRRTLLEYIRVFSSEKNGSLNLNKLADLVTDFTGHQATVTLLKGFLYEGRDTNAMAIRAIRRFLIEAYPVVALQAIRPYPDPSKTIVIALQACFIHGQQDSVSRDAEGASTSFKASTVREGHQITLHHQPDDVSQCDVRLIWQEVREQQERFSRLFGHVAKFGMQYVGYLADQETDSVWSICIETGAKICRATLNQVTGTRISGRVEFDCSPVLEGHHGSS